jgi:phytoene dehydrogenase-like protein
MSSAVPDVLVIGAGLAGLSCARLLAKNDISFTVIEASDEIGGRVRTDRVQGFLLDRGFQVLQTAYPEARRVLDYSALELKSFYPGALVRFNGRFHRVADPFRQPAHLLATLFSPVGSFADKLRVARLRRRVCRGSRERLFLRPEISTIDALRADGFSDSMIGRFFHPFFSGVFLDHELRASSRAFEFIFRMFASGDTALPSRGMGAIPEQLASGLPVSAFRFGAQVECLQNRGVMLGSGEMLGSRAVVVATEAPEAARLLGNTQPVASMSTCNLYFAVTKPPVEEPILVLNGEGVGPVTSFCVPSQVAPSYAPPGQTLVSVTVVGNPDLSDLHLEAEVRKQMKRWFGTSVEHWHHLKTYRIQHALPLQAPPTADPHVQPVRIRPNVYICGEYGSLPSINWAMLSGRRAAEVIIRELNR